MVFKCQEDSFLKEFETTVISCKEARCEIIQNGTKKSLNGYDIKLADTILFPEGGGQPCDYGYINESEVIQIRREGSEAIHFTLSSLEEGQTVKEVVDWSRRFDHMQQHSGQHLLSAIIDRDYGFNTDSWWLGEEVSYVEIDTPVFIDEDIQKIENVVNELIQNAVPVTVRVYKEGDPELAKASTRGLPENHKGDVRVISIGDIDNNMCCGTHVNNLSQLQIIKLLHVDKSKRKNKVLLHFLVGNRVLKKLTQTIDREIKITALLNNGVSKHVELIERLQKQNKTNLKYLQGILKEMGTLIVKTLKETNPKPKYYCLFRKDADQDFLNFFVREMNSREIFLLLMCGEEKGSGHLLIYGDEKAVADLGSKICELLNGKGSGKGNRFQAKVSNLGNRAKCEALLNNYFN